MCGALLHTCNDLYKKMISKISFFERSSKILEFKGPGLEGEGWPDYGIWVHAKRGTWTHKLSSQESIVNYQ